MSAGGARACVRAHARARSDGVIRWILVDDFGRYSHDHVLHVPRLLVHKDWCVCEGATPWAAAPRSHSSSHARVHRHDNRYVGLDEDFAAHTAQLSDFAHHDGRHNLPPAAADPHEPNTLHKEDWRARDRPRPPTGRPAHQPTTAPAHKVGAQPASRHKFGTLPLRRRPGKFFLHREPDTTGLRTRDPGNAKSAKIMKSVEIQINYFRSSRRGKFVTD